MITKSVNFIIPYFGEFPNYMQLYLNSCKKNPEFHWTIITDNLKKYDYPENVKVVYKTFEEVQRLVRSKFNFQVEINQPYKFCDMKPMYGYIFEDYNKGFDFWGYCDVDMILGDLKSFINDEMLSYDKVFTQGHMTIMRNSDEMNTLFMRKIGGNELYKTVLQSENSFNFDEDFLDVVNINTICRDNHISIWEEETIADIYTKASGFRRVLSSGFEKRSLNYYLWNDGKLIRRIKRGGNWYSEEYMYIHLQKRKMKVSIGLESTYFKIIPNEFAKLEISLDKIGQLDDNVKTKNINLHYFRLRFNNLKKKMRRRFN